MIGEAPKERERPKAEEQGKDGIVVTTKEKTEAEIEREIRAEEETAGYYILVKNIDQLTKLTKKDKVDLACKVATKKRGMTALSNHRVAMAIDSRKAARRLFSVIKKDPSSDATVDAINNLDYFDEYLSKFWRIRRITTLAKKGKKKPDAKRGLAAEGTAIVKKFRSLGIREKKHAKVLKAVIEGGGVVEAIKRFDIFTGLKTLKQINNLLKGVRASREVLEAIFENLNKFARDAFRADHYKFVKSFVGKNNTKFLEAVIDNYEKFTGIKEHDNLDVFKRVIFAAAKSQDGKKEAKLEKAKGDTKKIISYLFKKMDKFKGVNYDDHQDKINELMWKIEPYIGHDFITSTMGSWELKSKRDKALRKKRGGQENGVDRS